jgi:hypothetical protein
MTRCPHSVPTVAGEAADRCEAFAALLDVLAGQSGGCGIRTHEDASTP